MLQENEGPGLNRLRKKEPSELLFLHRDLI